MKGIVFLVWCCGFIVITQLGCTASRYKQIELTEPNTGEFLAFCYLRGRGGSRILGAGLKKVDGQWYVVGRMCGFPPLTRSRTTFRVEAVSSDEALVSSSVGCAVRKPSEIRPRRIAHAAFRIPIPAPDGFDHLHLALISPSARDLKLPAHELRR